MANLGQLLTKKIKTTKNKIWFPRHRTYLESTKDAHKSLLNVFWTSYAHPTYPLCRDGSTKTHRYIYTFTKIYNKNNPSCNSRIPGTPGTKSYAQMVNNYQSLTVTTKTYIPGDTGHVDALLNVTVIKKHLIGNLHEADSLEVSFAKFARAVFRNPIFDLWLEKLKGFTFPVSSANKRFCFNAIPNRVNFSRF